ncbi:MCE family protein [Nocardioides sp. Bht2]|uniref:MCE family protein n=1 Tax=Nocardioides sp. Bht2 TaxID=3392297 RepID=UPI0039B3AC30
MKTFSARLALLPAVAVLGLVASGCQIQPNDNTLPGQVAVGDDGYTVTVQFDQVENLVPNSTVQQDNVVIGTVAKIAVRDWHAEVELRLLDSVELPRDAVFAIGQKTLLGAQYVEVAAPVRSAGAKVPGRLTDGTVVPTAQTGAYPSTEQVLGGVALLLNNGGLSQISTITGELSAALRDRVPDTRSLVRRTNELLTVLDDNRAEVVNTLAALDKLAEGLAEDSTEIIAAVKRISPGLRALEKERTHLVEAVTATGTAGVRATRLIRTNRQALLANLDQLAPVLDRLAVASTDLPEALKIAATIPFPAMTTPNAIKGDYANLFATIDVTTDSLLGSWLSAAGPGGVPVDPTIAPNAPSKPGKKAPAKEPGATAPSTAPSATPSTSSCLLAFLGIC